MDARIVALAKTVKKTALDAARQGLSVGTHSVDCTVHITGSIKVGQDTVTETRGSVDYKRAFATICGMFVEQCKRRDVREPLSDELIGELIDIAMRQDELAASIAEDMIATVEITERDCTKVTGTKRKNGTVTTKLNYEYTKTPTEPPRARLSKRLRKMRCRVAGV